MKRLVWAAAICILLATSSWVGAFELSTHAALTEQTIARFLRERPTTLSEFGLPADLVDPLLSQAFGDQYFDMLVLPDNTPPRRLILQFEQDLIRGADQAIAPRSFMGWVMAGAIREDDFPWYLFGANPQDDPYANTVRVLNHFYDPVFNRGLIPCPVSPCQLAPNWATGSIDSFSQPNQENSVRYNHFTLIEVKEALFRALTLKSRDGVGWKDVPQPADAAGREALRNTYWATMFRALGDVLHVLQDMAQPQHTRNDAHAGIPGGGHKGMLELYLDARARGKPLFRISPYGGPSTTVNIATKPLPYQLCDAGGINCKDYPTPTDFAQYSDFFSTNPGSATGGKGLADFSNTQFFTAGKNLGNSEYSSPPNSLSAYTISSIAPTHWDGSPVVGGDSAFRVFLLSRGIVLDNLNPSYSATNVPLTSISIWDEFMQGRAFSPSFTLTRENFDAQAELLLPRAVAYGAGLLGRLFRGRLRIDLPAAGAYAVHDGATPLCKDACGFSSISLRLTNKSATDAMQAGTFFALAKFHRNDCYQSDLSGEPGGPNFPCAGGRTEAEEVVVSNPVGVASLLPPGPLAPNSQAAITFTFATPIPINATDIYLQVVFRGQLGNEADAVVVTTKNISEPNYIAVVNDLDYHYDAVADTFQPTDPKTTPQTVTNLDIKLNGASTPIATLAQLNVRGYAQLAFLTDLGVGGTEPLAIDFSAGGLNGPLSFSNFPLATFTSSGPGNYERSKSVMRYRGMWSDYRLDLFSISSPFNLYNCVAGDTRRICTSAGLTTIPASNAVAWTINFP